jgi:hypothetical protein
MRFLVEFFVGSYLTINIMCLINVQNIYSNGFESKNIFILTGDGVSLILVVIMPLTAFIIVYKVHKNDAIRQEEA